MKCSIICSVIAISFLALVAATPSPTDFNTDIEVKSKNGGAPTKQKLNILKGRDAEGAIDAFCAAHAVAASDCGPLKTNVVNYLKTLKPEAGAAASTGPQTPSPIDFSSPVDVKSKFGGMPSKQTLSIKANEGIEGAVAAFCAKHEVADADCTPLSAQVVGYLKTQKPAAAAAAPAAAAAGTASPIKFSTPVDVKSKHGGAPTKQTLSVAEGEGIEGAVRAFCTRHEVSDADCTPLTSQVVGYLKTQKPAAAAAAAAAPAAAGTASPIDFETMIEVKGKSGAAATKQPLKIAQGQAIEGAVNAFCAQHAVESKDCDPLRSQIVTYVSSQKAAPAAAASGTASPIDFETMVEVKGKNGAAPSKQPLKIAKGTGIEGTLAAFCTTHAVAAADCGPLTTQVVQYLKTKA